MKLKIKKYLKENRILNLFVKNEVDEKSELELITFPLILPMFFLIFLLIISGIEVFNRTKNLSESSVDEIEIVVVENKPINKNEKT